MIDPGAVPQFLCKWLIQEAGIPIIVLRLHNFVLGDDLVVIAAASAMIFLLNARTAGGTELLASFSQ